jgi:hypothetical protein
MRKKGKKERREEGKERRKKLGVVVHSCNPSYMGRVSRTIVVQGLPQTKAQDPT